VGWADTGVTVEAVIVITADRRGGAAPSGVRGSAGSSDPPGAATGLDANALRVSSPGDRVRGWEDREFPAGRRFLVPLSAVEPIGPW